MDQRGGGVLQGTVQIIGLAYKQLEQICECIACHISEIAASRCGELPEPYQLRLLFEERYGRKFVRNNANLHPGNFVSPQMVDTLSICSVPEDVKLRLASEITEDFGEEQAAAQNQSSETGKIESYNNESSWILENN
ncbi:Vacuolar protein sorting-associated protein Ist1 [Dillenia turbinata]|uniref:Vacuolar protein sorting-associated protein Ist1 n=1 Tax=Dillenia turbinata TaxID=194707 RepID=A0AAN8WF05_9MAGN